MSRKPTSEHGGKEVFDFRIHIILLEPSSPYICHRHVLSELEGFCGEPLLRPFALFSLIVRLIHLLCFDGGFSFQTCILLFYLDIQVEAVHFLDPLHGECYVELKSKEDLARALDKHALRVGTRLRRRLIEVLYGAIF